MCSQSRPPTPAGSLSNRPTLYRSRCHAVSAASAEASSRCAVNALLPKSRCGSPVHAPGSAHGLRLGWPRPRPRIPATAAGSCFSCRFCFLWGDPLGNSFAVVLWAFSQCKRRNRNPNFSGFSKISFLLRMTLASIIRIFVKLRTLCPMIRVYIF